MDITTSYKKLSTDGMQFGVNVGVNEKSKGVGVRHNLGDSKVKLPHRVVKESMPPPKPVTLPKVNESVEDTHETNKTAWMIGAVGLGWWLFK